MTGLCECGCGERAPIARQNHSRYGWVKGQSLRFVVGHNRRKSPVEYVAEDRGYETPCWIWQRCLHRAGYGRRRWRGETVGAHRVAYELANGPVPDGLFVLHRCDIRACVNPEHLYAGTPQQNADDMVARGRASSPLTAALVLEIRELVEQGWRQWDIARAYGVSQACVNDLKFRRTWSHV